MSSSAGEATPEDRQEQQASLTRDEPVAEPPVVRDDVPLPDALDQSLATAPGQHAADRAVPAEADEADALEQAVVVERDDDEQRD